MDRDTQSNGHAEKKVRLAVVTGGREEDLRRLLTTLAHDYGARENVSLLVVDNGPGPDAQPTFAAATAAFGDRALYVHESERGYANARNATLRNVGDADSLVLIDDDEVPLPGWLDNLLLAQSRSLADVVAGPVIGRFPPGAPEYFERSRVFSMEAPDYPEGFQMPTCATNNTLIERHVLDRVPDGFDPRFNRMSGEDTDFFLRARLRGCRIVWTNTAIVEEYLPAARLSRKWLFRRAMRAGNTRALLEFDHLDGVRSRLVRLAKALGLLGAGVLTCTVAATMRDRGRALRGIHRIGLACGMLLAFSSDEPWSP